jgi:hypothetical protein
MKDSPPFAEMFFAGMGLGLFVGGCAWCTFDISLPGLILLNAGGFVSVVALISGMRKTGGFR